MKKYGIWRNALAFLLALVLVLGNLSGIRLPAQAATTVYGGLGVKQTDPATVNNWKNYIGQLDTSMAGGVWTDKSVFETVQDYLDATDERERFSMALDNPRNFLIALSAMASSKTIVGYSYQPIDAMLVLDVSGSMDSASRDVRMVESANKAIGDLLALNNYNRVGVVLYSDSATLLMPLDRYTTTSTTTLNNQQIPSYIYLNNNDSVSVSTGVRNSSNTRPSGSREVTGGTYIQSGIALGMEELTDPNLDTVITEGFQVGTTRTPIMVLMSDGAPTYGINSYTDVGNRNMGNGSSTNADLTFMNQLTAAYAKAKIAQKYGSETEPLFYTLGLGVGSDPLALGVMDPLNANADDDVNDYWTAFHAAAEGDEITLENTTYSTWENWQYITRNRTVTKLNDGVDDNNDNMPLDQAYVDQYFPASNTNDLSTAFQSIVDTIILQTMYYPTLVEGTDVHHSGYLEFHDYIGPNMEVKAVEGVQLNDLLYTGERLAHLIATGMGTVQNPTEAGNELVRSVVNRMGMVDTAGKTATEQARELLAAAWNAGQLSYHTDYDGNVTWNNQICWYADADNKYLGFWDGEGLDAEMIGKAAYMIRSYGFLGEVGDGHRETDMLYADFQVRTALDTQGNVLEDIVYGRIPASLIPVVTYNISLDSNDPTTATEISMTVTGAQAPLRLIYEVGLRQEIDLLNMEGTATENLKKDADGNFIFYTNQWDMAGVDQGKTPDKLHNTYATFKPSEENERYYYHEDMPIYVRSGSGYTRYTGSAKPAANDGNTYYRAYVTYTAQQNGGSADYSVDYQVIPDSALAADSVSRGLDNGWVVKRGTLYLYQARAEVDKTANATGTLPYVEYPNVHVDAVHGYHLDAILGNNGLLTIDAPEGLKLTKKADETLRDDGQTYTFTVKRTAGSHDDANIYLVTEIDGVRSAWQPITFTDTYTLELGIGDSAWLAGLPQGNSYEITEVIDGQYKVSAITVDGVAATDAQVTVKKNHMAEVAFTNTAVYTGDISISKHVQTTYDPHENEGFTFDFDVKLTGADANQVYATTMVAADGTQTPGAGIAADAQGSASVQISLAHGQSMVILELPEGASVTATEIQKPGFTSNQTNDTATAQVVVGQVTPLAFTNTYKAEPVSPYGIVDVYAKKQLNGRSWAQGDSFTFVLEKHDADGGHTVIETISVDHTDADRIADFQSNANDLYTAPGTYSYRVKEQAGNLPGIAYDTATDYFDVIVADDGQGKLYIQDVVGRQGVDVVYDSLTKTWDVTAEFVNTYSADGAIQASLSVTKDVTDEANTGISKAGFVFELYDADSGFNIGATPRATATTNAQGVASFRDVLLTDEGDYFFLLKEAPGSINGMTYSSEVYFCIAEVTSNPVTSGLIAKGTVLDRYGQTVYENTVEYDPGAAAEIPVLAYSAPFVNTYTPASVKAELNGTKELTGRDINSNEFTFELYEASYNGDHLVAGDYITQTTNTGNHFTFKDIEALNFTKTGNYFFAIREKKGSLGGVVYDENTIFAQVHVVADLTTGALVINSLNYVNADMVNVPAVIRNTYSAAATDITIVADKTLTGSRELAAGMFQFAIYETDSTYTVSGQPLQTLANDSRGEAHFVLDYTSVGEHYYVIRERIPTRLDANGRLNGVKYDDTAYRVKVTVTDNLEGQLEATATYPDGQVSFVNDYTPTPVSTTLTGNKTLSGYTQEEGTFSFALYRTDAHFVPLDNVAEDTAANYAAGNGIFAFRFDELTFSEPGGYRYIIVEEDTGNRQVTYDPTVFYVLIEVTDNGEGRLVANTVIGTGVNSTGAITIPVTGMEFFNVFDHSDATLTITGNKTLAGQSWDPANADQVFTFELYEANEDHTVIEGQVPLTATNDPAATGAEGTFAFPALTFSQKGTYYYVVSEQLPRNVDASDPRDDSTGIVYDTAKHNLTVTVDVDPQDPTRLKATYTVDNTANAVTFTNTYTVEGNASVTIDAQKVLVGGTLEPGKFSFNLYETDAQYDITGRTPIGTLTNGADGSFRFDQNNTPALGYTEKGTHYYVLVEDASDPIDGIRYDTRAYRFRADVTDDGRGNLVASLTCVNGNAVVFTNVAHDQIVQKDAVLPAAPTAVINGQKVNPGQLLRYTISYHNYTGDVADVTITDSLPAYTEFVSASHNGVYNAGTVKWELTGIPADGDITVTVDVRVTALGGILENEAQVLEGNNRYTTNTVTNTVEEDEAYKTVTLPDAPTVSVDGQKVSVGDVLQYNITYRNKDNFAAAVTITDQIPANTTLVDGSITEGGVFAGGKITWNLDLAGLQEKTVSFQVKVNAPDVFIENQAAATDGVNDLQTNVVTNHTYAEDGKKEVSSVSEPTVNIDGNMVAVGQILQYTISYVNTTGSPVDVTITDTIPQYTKLHDAKDAAVNGDVLTWQFAAVAPKQTVTVSFQVEVVGGGQAIENQATIFDGVNKVTNKVINSTPEKTVDKDHVTVGETVTYTLAYRNTTGKEAKLVITDQLSDKLDFVPGSAGDGVYENGKLTWTFEKVRAGQIVTVSFQAVVNAKGLTGDVTNQAQFIENETAVTFSNKTVTQVKEAKLTLEKTQAIGNDKATAEKVSVKSGQTVNYYLTLKNTGEDDAYNITVTDAVPEGLHFVAADNGGTLQGSTVTWKVAKLAAGESLVLKLTVKIPAVNEDSQWKNVAAFTYADKPADSNGVTLELKVPVTPNTGDSFQLQLFATLMVLSSFGIAAVMICKKREKAAEEAE